MVKTVNLDENEHAVTMLRGLKQMKNEQDLCDFIIKVGGIEYQTHKNILSVGSPYFKAMLKHDTKESRDGKVEMKDVDPECVKSCINFLYSGNFDVPHGKIGQLLYVAIMLQLDKVKNAISDILDTSLNAENFYETRDIAKMYDLQTVSRNCKIYYKQNLMAISLQPGFQNVKKSDLILILKSHNMKLSEQEKLTVCLRWIGENPLKKENLFVLIKLINLKDLSSEYLSDILENDPVIGNDFRLHKLMTASYIEKMKAVKIADNKKENYRNQMVLFDRDANCLRSYDPATDEVTKFHNETLNHLRPFTAVTMDSCVYILCENKSVYRLEFRDQNSKWKIVPNMIVSHGQYPPVVSLSGSLFVIGSDDEATKVVEKFDPVANRWLRLNDKPEAICCPSLVSLNTSIFCIGGWQGRKALNSFCKFTPSSSKWVDLEPMKNARYGCGAVAVEQRIFVMGGGRDSESVTEVECYDVVSRQWICLSAMIHPHSYSVAHHIDGWIFAVDRFQASNKVEKYDIANDRWCKVEFKKVRQFRIYDSVSVHT